MHFISMILFILSLGFILYIIQYYKYVRRYPKGPFPLPLIGNLYHLTPDDVHEYVHKIGKEYGYCVTLFLPRPVVFFTDYSTVHEALVTKGDNFVGRSQLPPDTYFQKIPNTGIGIADGSIWRENRRTSLKILREFGMGKNLMEAQVNRSIDEMLHQLKEANNGVDSFDMNMPIQLCILNIMNETLFGYHFNYTNTEKFEFIMHRVSKHFEVVKNNFWVFIIQAWPWAKHLPIIGRKGFTEPMENFSEYLNFIEAEVDKIAETFDRNLEPTNFVQAYLAEMAENQHLSIENLYATVVDCWLAGMETTSTTLRWGMIYLLKHPDVQEKMRSELLSVVGKERRIEMKDKPNLPYFNAAVTEIQRISNILSFTMFHRCTEETVIGGKSVPKDALTAPQIYSVMIDDNVFENPREFRPERFLEDDGPLTAKNKLDRVIPFGLGRRQCIGEGLARMELFLVLGTLLLNYRFETTEPINMAPIFGAVLAPRPYKCRAIPI